MVQATTRLGNGAPPASLSAAFDPRRNSLAVLRLAFAAVVAVAHAVGNGYGWQPSLGRTDVGDLAVDGFFVLSGFLVTRSYLRLGSPWRYAWHRFLRIMPAFWTCLLVTALVAAPVAAVLSGRSPWSVFTTGDDPAWRYPLVNAALPILQYPIGGIRTASGETAFDGSLWTLQYEAACYAVAAVLGGLAVLRRRAWVVLLAVAAAWAGAVLDAVGAIPVDVPVLDNTELFRFLLVFLLGSAGHLFAAHVPVRGWLAVLATVVLAACLVVLPDYRLAGAVPFAYLCLYGAVRLPLRTTPAWDLSYGLYVYHWPVQILLLLAGAAAWGVLPFAAVSVLVTLALAVASWLLVEAPALGRKDTRPPRWLHRPAVV